MRPSSIAFGTLALLATSSNAWACRCPAYSNAKASEFLEPSRDLLAKLPSASAVFVGRVIAQEQRNESDPIVSTIEILQRINGDTSQFETLKGGKRWGERCRFDIRVSEVAVFITRKSENGEWRASGCDFPEQDVSSVNLVRFVRKEQRQ